MFSNSPAKSLQNGLSPLRIFPQLFGFPLARMQSRRQPSDVTFLIIAPCDAASGSRKIYHIM